MNKKIEKLLKGFKNKNNKYDAESDKTKQGEDFQDKIFEQIKSNNKVECCEAIREWIKKTFCLEDNDSEINKYEKEHGDITFVYNNKRYFVECVSCAGNNMMICELKRQSFYGKNKYYCLGFVDYETKNIKFVKFVPSMLLSKYLSKCKLDDLKGWKHRSVSCYNVTGIRNSYNDVNEFINSLK